MMVVVVVVLLLPKERSTVRLRGEARSAGKEITAMGSGRTAGSAYKRKAMEADAGKPTKMGRNCGSPGASTRREAPGVPPQQLGVRSWTLGTPTCTDAPEPHVVSRRFMQHLVEELLHISGASIVCWGYSAALGWELADRVRVGRLWWGRGQNGLMCGTGGNGGKWLAEKLGCVGISASVGRVGTGRGVGVGLGSALG